MPRERGLPQRGTRDRELHQQQLRGYGFFPGRGPRRGATVVPSPLRYWQFDPPRPVPVLVVVGIVGAWLGVYAWGGGWTAMTDEAPLAVGLGLVVLLANIGRLTVSQYGLSADVPAARTNPASIVPLSLVRAVHVGQPPPDWPRVVPRGGWLPGRTRVAVRYLGDDGTTDLAFSRWVRDPDAFTEALSGV